MDVVATKTILRIELWHAACLLALVVGFGWSRLIDPMAVLFGGVFMGVNFLLLSYGVAWILTPLAGRGRIKLGVTLLALKMVVFLGLLTTVFFRFDIDAISFALGISSLLFAIFVEAVSRSIQFGV